MAKVSQRTEGREEVLRRLRQGDSQVKGGLWALAWIELIEQGVATDEAERFFDEIRQTPHPTGSDAFKARASEGRRAFCYGQQDRTDALHLLRTLGYHEAIKRMPTVTYRGAKRSVGRMIRQQIIELLEVMPDHDLLKLHDSLKANLERTRRPR